MRLLEQESETDLYAPLLRPKRVEQKLNKPSLTYWQDGWRRFKTNPVALLALGFLIAVTLMALFGPSFTPYSYQETHLAWKNHPPSSRFWFGSDDLGRDLFTRICYGARISLMIGLVAAMIDLVIGVLWGGCAALGGERVDNILMRTADVLNALPYLLVVTLLLVAVGSGIIPIIIALTITGWIGMARIVRGELIRLREQEFILAAIALGASRQRILLKHMIPNAMGPILVTVTLTIPMAIFTEAYLSFLGLGIQAPMASWGTMASDALPALRFYPWRLFFPALFISVTMLAFNLVGDGLRDALDPKQRR